MKRKQEYFKLNPGDPPPVKYRFKRRARFSEIDALAIVWHGRYACYFEDAHTELARKCSITWDNLAKDGVSAPLAQFHIDYFKPLYLDEEFITEASLHWTDGARINVQYALTNMKNELCATGYSIQLFVDINTQEPLWFSPEIWEKCRKRWQNGEFYETE